MPLYEHTSGEKVRTVEESPEDERLQADTSWTLQSPEQEAQPVVQSAAARGVMAASTTRDGDA